MAGNSVAELAHLRVGQYVAEQRARNEHEHDIPAPSSSSPEKRVITISRQYGAGGHTVAELIARQLGGEWEIWDQELVDAVAKKANVRAALVSTLDEHSISRVEEFLRYVTNFWSITPEAYHRHLVQVLLALSQQGNKIIIGRGANFVLKNALRVRLVASDRQRIKSIVEREKCSEPAARERMLKVESERSHFIKSVFGRDVNDISEYDLTIQIGHVRVESAAASITAALEPVKVVMYSHGRASANLGRA
jgi:cytidylate kinase